MMLGTFPKAFSQAATSQGYFPKWQLAKCAISHAPTSQMYKFPKDIFPSGNFLIVNIPKFQFPMKEKRQLPSCTVSHRPYLTLNNVLYFL